MPGFLYVYPAVDGLVPFGEAHEDEVVNGYDRSYFPPGEIKGDLVAQAVIKVYTVMFEPLAQPVTAPQRRKPPAEEGGRIFKPVFAEFTVPYPDLASGYVKVINMIRETISQVADGITTVVSQSTKIKKGPLRIKSDSHTGNS
jgi:hypothetical protein